jgi:hypothetical protein
MSPKVIYGQVEAGLCRGIERSFKVNPLTSKLFLRKLSIEYMKPIEKIG